MNNKLKMELIGKFGSQIVAAKSLNIQPSRLSQIIRGHFPPNSNEIPKFERVLGVSLTREIFGKRGVQ